jgi:hypothetical protein
MSEIATDNYTIDYVCANVIKISDTDGKMVLVTTVDRVVRLGREANLRENGAGDVCGVAEDLRAIRSELLKCCNTMLAIAIDMTKGSPDDTPAWLDKRATQLARRAARLEIVDDTLCEIIDWAEKSLTKGDDCGHL